MRRMVQRQEDKAMKKAVEFIKEQRVLVARWVEADTAYLMVREAEGLAPDGVVERLKDRSALLDELDDLIEALEGA